jgi:hypothetical protein
MYTAGTVSAAFTKSWIWFNANIFKSGDYEVKVKVEQVS